MEDHEPNEPSVLTQVAKGVLGSGKPLFDECNVPIKLDLLDQRTFEQGVTLHHYDILNELEAGAC